MISFPPPTVAPSDLAPALGRQGFAVLAPEALRALAGADPEKLSPGWDHLLPDEHLRDGGSYRRRRHGCFIVEPDRIEQVPHRAHFQPVEYNALHGGFLRWFAPLEDAFASDPSFLALLSSLGSVFSLCRPSARPRWFVEVHQFRIDTEGGIGRPTPEGAHRDGVDFLAVILVHRQGIKGGETRVFDAEGPAGVRFTLAEPWSALLLDDRRVIHETTPIQPTAAGGHRDTLVVTFREKGFQGP